MQSAPRTKSGGLLGISFNLTNPEGMIDKANANIHRIMPDINTDEMHNSVGVLETGNVSMDLMTPARSELPRKKKQTKKNTKRKNTHKIKGKSR
jgi:hypothetical protein